MKTGRTRPAGLWRLAGLLIAVLLVAAAILIALAVRRGPAAGRAASTGSRQIAAETAVRNETVAWVTGQISRNILIGCDAVLCPKLAQHGFPAGDLNVIPTTAADPYGSQLVIATASIRSQFGSRLASVYAPEVIASFGAGADRIDVRVVAPDGPAAFEEKLRAGLQASKSSGTQLLHNRRIIAAATARTQLAAGRVDPRLLTMISFMAGQTPLSIVDFGSVAPGASPAVPLRFADIAQTDPAARMPKAAYVQALISLVHSEQPPYVPLSVGPVRLSSGQTVLRIAFGAPSPAGPLSP